jgi:hypothetical protein
MAASNTKPETTCTKRILAIKKDAWLGTSKKGRCMYRPVKDSARNAKNISQCEMRTGFSHT